MTTAREVLKNAGDLPTLSGVVTELEAIVWEIAAQVVEMGDVFGGNT